MDLYILRHAIAEERTGKTPGGDSQRRLTAEGAKKMRRIAIGLKAAEVSFDLILSSPFWRAKETAEIVAGIFKLQKKLQFSSELVPDGNPAQLINELKKNYRGKKSILLVGHEPHLSRLISLLISGDPGIPIQLKKGGLCKLSSDELRNGRCATLEWLLPPRLLKRLK
jgi:phosphohistidine phosphatase